MKTVGTIRHKVIKLYLSALTLNLNESSMPQLVDKVACCMSAALTKQ